MQEVNLGTGDVRNTNILMGIAPTAENREIKRRILKHMEAGNWKAIENDEQLAVTARRVSLYYDAKIDDTGSFAKVTQLGDTDNNPWKNADRFEKAWDKLEKAYTNSAITTNGMRASDAAFFESIFKLQTGLNNKSAMALGQNFQIFDEKVINNQLRQMQHTYQQIALGTEEGIRLSNLTGIKQAQAKTAIKHIDQTLQSIGGGLTMYNDLTFDTLPFFNIARDYFGVDPLFNYNQKMIKEAIRTGAAFEKFKEMVAAQGGDTSYIDDPEQFKRSKYIMPVLATEAGTIEAIDADMVGSIAVYLGAGRMKKEGEINRTAGITINKKIGDTVTVGETLAYIHTDEDEKVNGTTQNLQQAFTITNKKINFKSRVLEIVK